MDEQLPEKKSITASELMIECLEKFGELEPEHAILIFTTKLGHVAYRSTDINVAVKLGMLEFAREMIVRRAFDEIPRES
jgi:hypothetical protein